MKPVLMLLLILILIGLTLFLLLIRLSISYYRRKQEANVRFSRDVLLRHDQFIPCRSFFFQIPGISNYVRKENKLGIYSTDGLRHVALDKIGSEKGLLMVDYTGFTIWIFDSQMAKDIFITQRKVFAKPTRSLGYQFLRIFGDNILTVDDLSQTLKNHKAITGPAFSEQNLALVADIAIQLTDQTIESWQQNEPSQTAFTKNINEEFTMITLGVIAKAGFGKETTIQDLKPLTQDVKNLQNLTFGQAFSQFIKYLLLILLLRKFLPFGSHFSSFFARLHRIFLQVSQISTLPFNSVKLKSKLL